MATNASNHLLAVPSTSYLNHDLPSMLSSCSTSSSSMTCSSATSLCSSSSSSSSSSAPPVNNHLEEDDETTNAKALLILQQLDDLLNECLVEIEDPDVIQAFSDNSAHDIYVPGIQDDLSMDSIVQCLNDLDEFLDSFEDIPSTSSLSSSSSSSSLQAIPLGLEEQTRMRRRHLSRSMSDCQSRSVTLPRNKAFRSTIEAIRCGTVRHVEGSHRGWGRQRRRSADGALIQRMSGWPDAHRHDVVIDEHMATRRPWLRTSMRHLQPLRMPADGSGMDRPVDATATPTMASCPSSCPRPISAPSRINTRSRSRDRSQHALEDRDRTRSSSASSQSRRARSLSSVSSLPSSIDSSPCCTPLPAVAIHPNGPSNEVDEQLDPEASSITNRKPPIRDREVADEDISANRRYYPGSGFKNIIPVKKTRWARRKRRKMMTKIPPLRQSGESIHQPPASWSWPNPRLYQHGIVEKSKGKKPATLTETDIVNSESLEAAKLKTVIGEICTRAISPDEKRSAMINEGVPQKPDSLISCSAPPSRKEHRSREMPLEEVNLPLGLNLHSGTELQVSANEGVRLPIPRQCPTTIASPVRISTQFRSLHEHSQRKHSSKKMRKISRKHRKYKPHNPGKMPAPILNPVNPCQRSKNRKNKLDKSDECEVFEKHQINKATSGSRANPKSDGGKTDHGVTRRKSTNDIKSGVLRDVREMDTLREGVKKDVEAQIVNQEIQKPEQPVQPPNLDSRTPTRKPSDTNVSVQETGITSIRHPPPPPRPKPEPLPKPSSPPIGDPPKPIGTQPQRKPGKSIEKKSQSSLPPAPPVIKSAAMYPNMIEMIKVPKLSKPMSLAVKTGETCLADVTRFLGLYSNSRLPYLPARLMTTTKPLPPPFPVHPLIKLSRWSLLIAGIFYGANRKEVLLHVSAQRRKEAKMRHEAARLQIERDRELSGQQEIVGILGNEFK